MVQADKQSYRVDELADAAGVSVCTIRRLIKRGLIAHVRILGLIRIPRSEYQRVISKGIGGEPGKN